MMQQTDLVIHMAKAKKGKRMQTTTAFRQWRQKMQLTPTEAAVALGLSGSMITLLDGGKRYDNNVPVLPRKDTRMLMTVIAQGQKPEPWPLK